MTHALSRRLFLTGVAATCLMQNIFVQAALANTVAQSLELKTANGRRIAVSHWQPSGRIRGVILFSHGALSAPKYYERIITPWVAAGYEVFAPLHVDSAEHPETKNYPGLMSWTARLEDMRALSAHIGNRPFIAAGHSYGGLTAVALGGGVSQIPEGITGPLRDPNAKVVLAFSPPAPMPALTGEKGYGPVSVPALIQTGTKDILPGMTTPDGWKGHLAPFDAATATGTNYALVLDDVSHYFGGLICNPKAPGPPTPEQLDRAVAISLLFLDGFAAHSNKAKRKLNALTSDSGPVMLTRK